MVLKELIGNSYVQIYNNIKSRYVLIEKLKRL